MLCLFPRKINKNIALRSFIAFSLNFFLSCLPIAICNFLCFFLLHFITLIFIFLQSFLPPSKIIPLPHSQPPSHPKNNKKQQFFIIITLFQYVLIVYFVPCQFQIKMHMKTSSKCDYLNLIQSTRTINLGGCLPGGPLGILRQSPRQVSFFTVPSYFTRNCYS